MPSAEESFNPPPDLTPDAPLARYLPPELSRILKKLSESGRPLLVGGCVRDWLLGLRTEEFDIEVFGLDYVSLLRILRPFGATDLVGKQFGVVKVRVDGQSFDFSLPRREIKTGKGHRGFDVQPDPHLPVERAARRRDFTLNSISWDPQSGEIIDPLGGVRDLRNQCLRHAGEAFAEDPLRVLRAFQLAARFRLTLAPETGALCRSIRHTFEDLPRERIWGEWEKWAARSVAPARGLEVLKETGWLSCFPEIEALDGVPQDPEWHPEGDVWQHTLHCVDSLAAMEEWRAAAPAKRRDLMLAVLAHDFGKTVTTERAEKNGVLRWVSPRHETEGGKLAATFLERIGAPNATRSFVIPLVENHLFHIHTQDAPSPGAIRRLARRLAPASIDDLCLVMLADARGRPPRTERNPPGIESLREGARKLEIDARAPKPILQGRHLMAEGLKPGPHFREILDTLFEAQLDGAFSNEEEALRYLHRFLADHQSHPGDPPKQRQPES